MVLVTTTGDVYAFGGQSDPQRPSRAIHRYQVWTNTWETLNAKILHPRVWINAVVFQDKILISSAANASIEMFDLETAQSRLMPVSLPQNVTSGWFTMSCVESYLIIASQSQLLISTGRFGDAQHAFDLGTMQLESDAPAVSPYDNSLYFATQAAAILCFKPSTLEWFEYQPVFNRHSRCLTYPSEWHVTETELIVHSSAPIDSENAQEDRISTTQVLERIALKSFQPLGTPSASAG